MPEMRATLRTRSRFIGTWRYEDSDREEQRSQDDPEEN